MKSGLLRIIFIVLLLPIIAFGKILPGEAPCAIQSGTPTLTGSEFACVGIGGYIYTTDPGMTGYVWLVTGGDITSGGTSTSSTVTVTWTTPGPQSVSVTYKHRIKTHKKTGRCDSACLFIPGKMSVGSLHPQLVHHEFEIDHYVVDPLFGGLA